MKSSIIEVKAKQLLGMIPGKWDDAGDGVMVGHCPGWHLHADGSSETGAKVYLRQRTAGQLPGVFCTHVSCKGMLDEINAAFRSAVFEDGEHDQAEDEEKPVEEEVVQRALWKREEWVEDFSLSKLRELVGCVPKWCEKDFMERSPVDVRKVGPAEFLEYSFNLGDRVLVFTDFQSQGDFLWEVGRGGYRLGSERGVQAVRSKLPTDGEKVGIWFLSNPVDAQWHANSRRSGKYSRRSTESVTSWRHMVLECDEDRIFRKRAGLLRDALAGKIEPKQLETLGGKVWGNKMRSVKKESWVEIATQLDKDSMEVPGLWMKFLAMAPLAIKAIYTCGGSRLHALVEVNMKSKADFDEYLRMSAKRTLPIVGADPAALSPLRLSRLPGCTRNGREQKLLYLNPKPTANGMPVPITELKSVRKVTATL